MIKNTLWEKTIVITIVIAFFSLTFTSVLASISSNKYHYETFEPTKVSLTSQNITLPQPIEVDMILEESIFRRSSVRDLTDDPVSDENLSTVLWAAYGYRDDENRTVPKFQGVFAVHIYVLRHDGVYKYEPLNHTLLFYKQGDYTNSFQYPAPIQLGIVWDVNISSNENLTGAEIGMIGQNVYLMANALNLGTLATIGFPLSVIGLPENEIPKIIMPLGHPKYTYDFRYRPLVFSFLPRVQYSNISLSTAINKRMEEDEWDGELSKDEQAQIIWSTYGYSYFIDRSEFDFVYHINRHRTVPSAHKYYPLRIYAITQSGVYRYIPNIYDPLKGPLGILFTLPRFSYPVFCFMMRIRMGDHRQELAEACQEPVLASAGLCIVSVLDIKRTRPPGDDDFSALELRWIWYYEAGASAYNVLLETTAWDLSGNIFIPTDFAAVRSLLRLNESYFPLLTIPVGK